MTSIVGRENRIVRRLLVVTAAAAVAAGCQAIELVMPQPSCGCAQPASPTPRWLPVAPEQAVATAARIVPALAGAQTTDVHVGDRWLFPVQDARSLVAIDGKSGEVVLAVFGDQLPDEAEPAKPAGDAIAAAESFASAHGLALPAADPDVLVVERAGVRAYEVRWPAGSDAGTRIWVNAATGGLFALASGVALEPPVIGQRRAAKLAVANATFAGQVTTSVDLELWLNSDGLVTSWIVGLGVPVAGSTDTFSHGAVLSVNAATGDVTFLKAEDAR